MEKLKYWLLSISTGVTLAVAWPETLGPAFFIFFGLIGLLYVEKLLSEKSGRVGKAVFGYAFVSFFIFNLITAWWIYFVSPWGAVGAIVFNSLLMAVVFWLFHITKQKIGKKQGYIALVLYWIAFEYLHLNWDLSLPWLNLGNVFANNPEQVQWFEYTGALGGSLWILIANLIFFFALHFPVFSIRKSRNKFFGLLLWAAIILIPTFWSKSVYNNYEAAEDAETVNVVLVQPNIDPNPDRFDGMEEAEQIDLMVSLAREKVDESTNILILPEAAFPSAYWEREVSSLYGTEELKKIIKDFPQLRIVAGLSTSILFGKEEELPVTAKKWNEDLYYVNYNTAMQLDSSQNIVFYHKSKLVLGVEMVPFLKYIPWMRKLLINLGGAAEVYGSDAEPTVFFDENKSHGLAPIICYESIYGEYVNEYAKKGADLYVIITNDGWWNNSPGYKQHLAYARLRAVEGRRNIVRSANTGISAIINSRGDIVERTNWWEPDALKGEAKLNDKLTFYIQYGDYIGRIAAFVSVMLVLLTVVKILNKTKQRLKGGNKK